jgi:hypothetical protein
MYSGTTLTKMSGRVMGAHQKIDRVARKHLSIVTGDGHLFPSIKNILYFEGKNGPDGIKRKSPSRDEPWHFYSPFDKDDSQLIELIKEHYYLLVKHLKDNNKERAAFEAAWLAHALVDGLTPAHHYPYEEKISDIRGTTAKRTSVKEKILMPGQNKREKFKNNWKVWGAKGLFTNHYLFEWGIAAIIKPLNFSDALPKESDIETAEKIGVLEWFRRTAREIAVLDMYERYHRRGWSTRLTVDVRQKLAPAIIKTVTVAWYLALEESGKLGQQK